MTIGLTYNDDISRVQIALSGYDDGTVNIERSTNQLFWQTVRGGIALPVVGGVANLDDTEFTPDVQNFYRTLAVDPPAGLVLPGTAGNYASTPDTAVLDIIGDIDLRAEATLDDWTAAGTHTLIGKWAVSPNRSFAFSVITGGFLRLHWSTTGSNSILETSAVAVPITSGRLAVRAIMNVNNGAGDATVRFYTADTIDGPWTLLGAFQSVGAITSIFASNAALTVGAIEGGAVNTTTGTIHAIQVFNGVDGTVVANPDFAAQDTNDTSFVDGAGRTWTVHGTAEILGGVIEVNSITPNLNGAIWLKVPEFPFLNREIECVIAGDVERQSRTGIFDIKGRSVPVAVSDLKSSPSFSIAITTRTLEQARDMDLILAVGKTMLIHVPQENTAGCGPVSAVPGGYVEIGDTTQRRGVPGGRAYQFTLPCVVVSPPGPDVIPTTLIWGTVFNLWGGWDNLIASNPTWLPLLQTVGSPNDPVVL